MNKVAILINGVSAPIRKHNFLSICLEELGYEVVAINLVNEKVKFDSEVINDFVKEKVNNKQIDLIMGWSMGAMVAPMIAVNYPKARLILVAGGVGHLNKLKYLKPILGVIKHGLYLPKEWLVNIYEKINPVGDGVKQKYRDQMNENIEFFRDIGTERMVEVFDFLAKVDNESFFRKIKNRTLVMSGRNDKLLPIAEGQKIANLVKGSRFVITDGGHYNVISRNELPIIKEFLK